MLKSLVSINEAFKCGFWARGFSGFEYDIIQNNIKKIEVSLNITTSYDILQNISTKSLQTAAEMFLYLNHCPPKILNTLKDIVMTYSTQDIFIHLMRIIESSLYYEKSATKIFRELTKILPPLQYQELNFVSV